MSQSPEETTHTSWPTTLQEKGAGFKKRVSNPSVFKAYMVAKMPTLGVTRAYLEDIDVASSRIMLPFGRRTKDLFGRMAFAALSAAAETASSSLLMLNLRNQESGLYPVLLGVSMEVLIDEEIKEDLWLICEEPELYAEFVHQAGTGESDVRTLSVRARTYDTRTTHRFEFKWALRPKP